MSITLPNIRKLYLPDPGFVICDSDLAQADAQVVAWESDDAELKAIFRDPTRDLHDENALAIFGKVDRRTRPLAKRGVHAVNYGAKARTLSASLGISLREAKYFIDKWFSTHPRIYDWQRRIEQQLCTSRTIRNPFGFRQVYTDRIEHLLPQALAWIPQSTVAIAIDKALLNLESLEPNVQNLLQVHDSLVYQVRQSRFRELLPQIRECFRIEIPYPDPLVIPAGIAMSPISWGECREMTWEGE